jgi:hypothetical protein
MQPSGDRGGLCRPEGVAQWNGDGVWMSSVAGLGGIAPQSRDCAGLCRPEGRGPSEWIISAGLCRPGGGAWQALGMQAC